MATRYDYVLVGAGVASVAAAQNIRENDAQGTIVIIGDEAYPPYDRPPLSKQMLLKDEIAIDDPYSKFDDFYPKNAIDLLKSTRVTAIDRNAKTVTLDDDETLEYGKLLLATGSHAIRPNIPGATRPDVHLLRHIGDSLKIRDAIFNGTKAVLIGAGYIGMEVAAAAKTRGLEVTIIEQKAQPWPKFASPQFGAFLQKYFEAQGVRLLLNQKVASIEGYGEDGAAHTLLLPDETPVYGDFFVLGTGIALNTELAQQAGLDVDPKEGVRVNEYLQTADPHIYAAGDIAFFKDIALETEWHAEHHLNAKWQGQAVGKNMAGANAPYDRVAYFFSDMFDIHMILRGKPQAGKQSLFVGDIDGAEFTELYYDETGRLRVGISVSHDEPKLDTISDTLETLIRRKFNVTEHAAQLQEPGFDLNTLVG